MNQGRYTCVCAKSLQSCLTFSLHSCPSLFDLLDFNLPGCSVHEILQARILEWCQAFFKGIFPTQGLNQGLLHLFPGSLTLVQPGKPRGGMLVFYYCCINVSKIQCLNKNLLSYTFVVQKSNTNGLISRQYQGFTTFWRLQSRIHWIILSSFSQSSFL